MIEVTHITRVTTDADGNELSKEVSPGTGQEFADYKAVNRYRKELETKNVKVYFYLKEKS